ncbi:MAG: helix-turn-helix transcriptional regulator [Bacteroidetes bacterium]|nr:helix-turn-helix transcriptional regulator [Bacteroidota bacterium]
MHAYRLTLQDNQNPEQLVRLDLLQLKKSAILLRAINHKLRQEILLWINQKGSVTVTELYVQLRLEQSVASQHLAVLRKAGFVKTTREGKKIFYSVNIDRIKALAGFMEQLLG